MKTSIPLAFLGFAAMAAAQFGNLPDCAKGCATSSLPANCNLDVKCICSDSAFISGISCCVEKACSPPDQQKTLQVAQQLCDTVQVTLPSAASCPGGAGPSGASSAATSATSPAASSAASSASSMASSAASMASGASSSATGGASSAASMSSTAASGASSAGAATPSATTSAKTGSASGGAVKELGSKMGAVGAAVAALYLI